MLTVFYTTSYYGKGEYQKAYDAILAVLRTFEIKLIGTEVGNYQEFLPKRKREQLAAKPKLLHYAAIRHGIALADAVVIEVSHEDFQLGHEATLAVDSKKPTLCLSQHEDWSQKIHHEYLFGAKYGVDSVKPLLQDFLARARDMHKARRFNLFLYPQQLEYLEQIGRNEGMNRAEYIRMLINTDRQLRLGVVSENED